MRNTMHKVFTYSFTYLVTYLTHKSFLHSHSIEIRNTYACIPQFQMSQWNQRHTRTHAGPRKTEDPEVTQDTWGPRTQDTRGPRTQKDRGPRTHEDRGPTLRSRKRSSQLLGQPDLLFIARDLGVPARRRRGRLILRRNNNHPTDCYELMIMERLLT